MLRGQATEEVVESNPTEGTYISDIRRNQVSEDIREIMASECIKYQRNHVSGTRGIMYHVSEESCIRYHVSEESCFRNEYSSVPGS